MKFEEFREGCPAYNENNDDPDGCGIDTWQDQGCRGPCMYNYCPLWYLRETIMKEIDSKITAATTVDNGKGFTMDDGDEPPYAPQKTGEE